MINAGLLNRHLQDSHSACERGDWSGAMTHARSALALAPTHAGAHNLLGYALLQAGKADEAVAEFEAATRTLRNDPAMIGNLAQAYAAAGRHEDAHQAWRRAQRLAPEHWPYTMGAAVALAQQGRRVEAEKLLSRLSERHPRETAILYNLGNVRRELSKLPEAAASFRAALALVPEDMDIRLSLGAVLHGQSDFAAAEALYRECMAMQAQAIAPRLNLVSLLIDAGRFEEAETAARALIEMAPDLPDAHRLLGAALGHQGKLAQAISAFAATVQLAPNDALARRILGGTLAEAGRIVAGLRELAAAGRLEPDSLSHQQMLSVVLLSCGMFAEGWAAYQSRPSIQGAANRDARFARALPADLQGVDLRIQREQGLGDELFFMRYLPELKRRGACVTVLASARLVPLIERAAVADQVIAEPAAMPDTAPVIYCGDLPSLLEPANSSPLRLPPAPGAVTKDFEVQVRAFAPMPAPSLRIAPLPDAVARMDARLRASGKPPYLGLTWRAGTAAHAQGDSGWMLKKQLPVDALGRALRGWPGTLIVLQRLPADGEISVLSASCGCTVADFTDVNNELEDMLALLQLLDDYVGVSNTNMHLRAAAGRTARVLVPAPAEWRWMQSGAESPWFPGFRIYRQSLRGDWQTALTELATALGTGAH